MGHYYWSSDRSTDYESDDSENEGYHDSSSENATSLSEFSVNEISDNEYLISGDDIGGAEENDTVEEENSEEYRQNNVEEQREERTEEEGVFLQHATRVTNPSTDSFTISFDPKYFSFVKSFKDLMYKLYGAAEYVEKGKLPDGFKYTEDDISARYRFGQQIDKMTARQLHDYLNPPYSSLRNNPLPGRILNHETFESDAMTTT